MLAFLLTLLLVPQLGDDLFRRREAAFLALDLIGHPAALQLGEQSHDPEIRERCRLLLARNHLRFALRYVLTRVKPWPFLDMNAEYRDGRLGYYLSMAQRVYEQHHQGYSQGWPEWRLATQLYVHDLLATGHNLADVESMLEKMRIREVEYTQRQPPSAHR